MKEGLILCLMMFELCVDMVTASRSHSYEQTVGVWRYR